MKGTGSGGETQALEAMISREQFLHINANLLYI
jgi:hypothetical protein